MYYINISHAATIATIALGVNTVPARLDSPRSARHQAMLRLDNPSAYSSSATAMIACAAALSASCTPSAASCLPYGIRPDTRSCLAFLWPHAVLIAPHE